MKLRLLLLALLSGLLSACASQDNGCDSASCRPLADSHHLTIWWPSDMRNGTQDYTQVTVR